MTNLPVLPEKRNWKVKRKNLFYLTILINMEHSSSSDDVIMLSVSRTRLKTILVSHLHMFRSNFFRLYTNRKKTEGRKKLTVHISLLFKLDKSITTRFVGLCIFDQSNLKQFSVEKFEKKN